MEDGTLGKTGLYVPSAVVLLDPRLGEIKASYTGLVDTREPTRSGWDAARLTIRFAAVADASDFDGALVLASEEDAIIAAAKAESRCVAA